MAIKAHPMGLDAAANRTIAPTMLAILPTKFTPNSVFPIVLYERLYISKPIAAN
jgi:hypothetical protein